MMGKNSKMICNSSSSSSWCRLNDKLFERALVIFPEETPDRWQKIASQVPGKTWLEVKEHYEDLVHDLKEIDSGRVELPSYEDELLIHGDHGYWRGSATVSAGTNSGQVWFGSNKGKEKETNERRKGIPWTEEEHRLFLIGLQRYGKGDWRSISRNAVVSRTPTQVASHAQKYFLRLNSVNDKKDKKRPSIHDITTSANYVTVNNTSMDHQTWMTTPNDLMMDPKIYTDSDFPSANFHGFGFSL